jgi:cell division protein FtsZ
MMKLTQTSPADTLDVRVIGVGGAGCSSLGRLATAGFAGTEMLGIDTGSGTEILSGIVKRLSIGNGFGSGGDPETAVDQFLSVQQDIVNFVSEADVVIILAGLGRGTGSGIAPVIAELAREAEALTFAAVNMPFEFEGRFRSQAALLAHARLTESADAVITMNNDELSKLSGGGSLNDAFQEADRQIANTVQAITTALEASSDRFSEVRASLHDAGASQLLSGAADGVHAGEIAVESAFSGSSEIIDEIASAVIHIEGGIGLSLGQVAEAVTAVRSRIGRGAEVHVSSERKISLGQSIRITLVLAGKRPETQPAKPFTPYVNSDDHGMIPSFSIFDTQEPIRKRGPMLLPTG